MSLEAADASVSEQHMQGTLSREPVVTTLGTCRIADPMAALAQQHQVRRNTTNVYGFVHTSKEVLQLIDVLEGREIPADLVRFIASANYEMPRQRDNSDLFFVEISSAKEIHFQDHLLQINCVDRIFQGRRELFDTFFRYKYPHERKARAEALQSLEAFHAADPVERAFLLEGHVHLTTRAELSRDLCAIASRLRGPVVFVCHIDVADSSGKVIESRARLCGWMRELCAEHGFTLFDPGPQVMAFGRAQALAEEGRDANHYTTEFKPVVGGVLLEAATFPGARGRAHLRVVPKEEPAAATAPPPLIEVPPPQATSAPEVPAAPAEVRTVASEAKARIGRGEMDEAEVLLRGAVIDHPGTAEFYSLLGAIAYHRGENTVALADLQRALQLESQAREPRMLLVKIAQRLNRHEESCAHALELVDLAPNDQRALTVAAKALLKAKRFQDASSIWRRVAALRPEIAAPFVEVARCELKGRNPVEAILAADAALAREPGDPGALTLKAEALQRLKRMDELAALALRMVPADPSAAMALVPALIAAAHQEHAAAVIAAVRAQGHASAADPMMQAGLLRSLTNRARAAGERGDAPAAAAAWNAVRLIDPDSRRAASGLRRLVSPHRQQARRHGLAGDLESAIAACRAGLALDPADARLRFELARLLERDEQWPIAARAWEEVAGGPGGEAAHLLRAARAATRAGSLEEALRLYVALPAEARQEVASKIASITRRLVRAMREDFAAERYDAAVRTAEAIRAIDPRNEPAARLLSRAVSTFRKLHKAAREQGDVAAQQTWCARILAIDPNRADALKSMVRIHTKARRPREAIELLERLTRIEPEVARHWHKLASACRSARRYDLGVNAALRAVELDPDNAKGLERLSKLLNRQALAA